MPKSITEQTHWETVAQELEAERLKLVSYDMTLLHLLRDVRSKRLLDYGCGPGVLALALHRGGADIRAYDISEEMRKYCGDKIGHDRVYTITDAIPRDYY
ncbi:methyltransferase domain-containing protein [Candidatus Woesearchaeota archaeon]|nr:methyltransferase domain-containing protein [Candidatus Woesearchaeota archaeon]